MHDKSYLRLVATTDEGEQPAPPKLTILRRQIDETERAYQPSQVAMLTPGSPREMLALLREDLAGDEPVVSLVANVHVTVIDPQCCNALVGLHFRAEKIEVVHTESPQYWIVSGPASDGSGATTELHFADGELKLVSLIARAAAAEQTVETVQ